MENPRSGSVLLLTYQFWHHLKLTIRIRYRVDLLVKAGHAFPDYAGIDRTLDRFRRVIAAGEKAAKGLGIEPKRVCRISLILVSIPYNNT